MSKRKKRKKSKKRKLSKRISIFGTILSLIFTIMVITLIILLKILGPIPDIFIYIGSIIILFFVAVTDAILIVRFKKKKTLKIVKSISIFLAIISILGSLFGIYYLNKTIHFFDNISIIKEEVTDYYIIVLNDSKYQETSDLYEKTLAYFEVTDKEVVSSIKLDLNYIKVADINLLKEKLYNKEVDAILISDIIKNIFEENDEEFNDNIKILETISIKKEIEDITKEVSMKNTPFSVLISGIDTYGDINKTTRNDVNIVATINPNTNEVLLTSIPRDYYVPLHGKEGHNDKLTHASYYGTNTVVKTIEDLLDIDINYYVKVNFTTLVELVDELGGIEVYADQAVYLKDGGCNIKNGYNTLNGKCALAFSRERHSYEDGDRHRGRNQQEVIKAVFNKMTSGTTLITEYTNILKVLDGKFATNVDMNDAMDFVKYELNDLSSYEFITTQLDGTGSVGETYSYPNQDLWIMIPDEKTIKDAKNLINKMLNNKSIK